MWLIGQTAFITGGRSIGGTSLADNPVILGKMLQNDPNATFGVNSSVFEPRNPIAVCHRELEGIAKAVPCFSSDATGLITAEVMDVSFASLFG